tara:strand:+ start:2341 stop:2451 length:111 start_codon:yes stop_codon:yes gene_type:complete
MIAMGRKVIVMVLFRIVLAKRERFATKLESLICGET